MKKPSKLVLTEADTQQLQRLGKPAEDAEREYQALCRGTRTVTLLAEATLRNKGIVRLDADALSRRFAKVTQPAALGKFVPASGAASRMLKLLQAARQKGWAGLTAAEAGELDHFVKALGKGEFAFGIQLDAWLHFKRFSRERMLAPEKLNDLLDAILGWQGLDLANLPKALIPFHKYGRHDIRLPLEEHLREAAVYSQGRVHFTITPEHEKGFRHAVELIKEKLRQDFPSVNFYVTFSCQDRASDAVALATDGSQKLFRLADGRLLLRPAGHGALLPNLNRMDADVVFIKNIDNISGRPAGQKATLKWKMAMAVYLLEKQAEIFGLLRQLDGESVSAAVIKKATKTAQDLHLSVDPKFSRLKKDKQVAHLHALLNRPLRVAGMVKNTGEPGGGPFFIAGENRGKSLQIVEHGEMNLRNPRQAALMKKAAYFSPTDIVVGLKDFRGRRFNLSEFSDPERYFISPKSHEGRPLLGYERPGLWNGSMARWINLFVETPAETFTPVKTINDLLRPEHRAS